MRTLERVFTAHMLVAVAALAIGFAMRGPIFCSFLVVLFGFVWFVSQQRGVSGLEGLLFFAFLVAAAAGIFFSVPRWLMLAAVVATLGAWDLNHFLQRLGASDNVDFEAGLGREHLRRLLIVEGVGFLGGLLALNLRVAVGFWWAVLFALLVTGVLAWITRRIRKETGR